MCGGQRVLPRLELAGRNLHRHAIERRTVLAHEADVAVVREGNDRNGTGVAHDVAHGLAAVRHLHVQGDSPRRSYPSRLSPR